MPSDVSDRFAKLWHQWDERVPTREHAGTYLTAAKDEDLIELLAGASVIDRKYERDVIATEVLNRMARRRNELPVGANGVKRYAEVAYTVAVKGQKAIHTAEGILKTSGERELGEAISASAYTSLDSTKLAFEAAEEHAADVEATLTQSRASDRFAESAADAAQRGEALASRVKVEMKKLGHEAEGKAAAEAVKSIARAASTATEAAAQHAASEEARAVADKE